MHAAIALAIYAGLGWAMGQFGKRYGAVDDKEESAKDKAAPRGNTQLVTDSFVSIIYLLGACSSGILPSLHDLKSTRAVLHNSVFWNRIPVSMMLGITEGLGTFLSVVVLGFAGRHSMTAVAPVIMNGSFAMCAPVLVAFFFKESLGYWFWAGLLCLVLGIVLASGLASSNHGKAKMGPGLLIVVGSFFVACFWSCGTLGTRYIMAEVPADLKNSWSSVSYVVNVMPMWLSPFVSIVANAMFSDIDGSRVIAGVKKRSKVCFLCGMVSGTGGLSLQHALAEGGGASLVGLSQGVYNVSCVLIFKAIYQETLTWSQLFGINIMLMAIVLLSVAE
mmetsp:Transcript_50693/g.90991  ORF Transcript_50693/g.90991 Transcript_50693/m.90991 type:complete len:333 (+) Transcript_50693:106-1104(+)